MARVIFNPVGSSITGYGTIANMDASRSKLFIQTRSCQIIYLTPLFPGQTSTINFQLNPPGDFIFLTRADEPELVAAEWTAECESGLKFLYSTMEVLDE